jgi:hypothetical protein
VRKSERATVQEPAATSAFLAAYARGDETRAEQLASPLYRAEWKRRHVTVEQRVGLLAPTGQATATASQWIRFTYAGGATSANGFTHLLFVGRASREASSMGPEVWRVDTDADGRVIWLELVWLMSHTTTGVRDAGDPATLRAVAFPPGVASSHPTLIMDVRAVTGDEGYYAGTLDAMPSTEVTGRSASTLVFFAIDADGGYRPGAWTFGEASPGLPTYGQVPERPAFELAPNDRPVLFAYLASL